MELKFVKASCNNIDYLMQLRMQTMVEHLESTKLFLTEQQHLNCVSENFSDCHLIKDAQHNTLGMIKYRISCNKIEVMQFQIAAKYQGQGLGSQIIKHLINEAKSKPIELSVLKNNPAFKLYQRLGFVQYKEDEYEFYLRYE